MAEPLREKFFTKASIDSLGEAIRKAYPDFNKTRYLKLIYAEGWQAMGLKEKMHHTTRCLGMTLPESYPEALEILKQVAPEIQGFEAMVPADYVEMYGQDDWDLSMAALRFFTQFASAEFAVRPFLDRDPERALAYLHRWADDLNPNVRRLASEGCRPRLPWGMALSKFKEDPTPLLPILAKLKDDETETVRKSVANNLNDISKDHPDFVLDICEQWYGKSHRTDWIVKHACRGLLKAGNTRALKLFGFLDPEHVKVDNLQLGSTHVRIGAELFFSFDLHVGGQAESKLRLEYAVYYQKARGALSKKVFQFSEKTYMPGVFNLTRKHSFANRSTRTHYPGEHQLAIYVNGIEKAETSFRLLPGD